MSRKAHSILQAPALRLPSLAFALVIAVACGGGSEDAAAPEGAKNEVLVLGSIHGYHKVSDMYDLERLAAMVRNIRPDYVLAEIPPDRMDSVMQDFLDSGKVTDPRVQLFVEYVDAILPVSQELGFEIIPVDGWTEDIGDFERDKLAEWRETRKEESEEIHAAMRKAQNRIIDGGRPDDPKWIHTDEYDAIVREGQEPLVRLFNDDLGAAGWENKNLAHYALISSALDAHRGEGKRFLIVFGSWHKYWLHDRLRERDDVEILEMAEFIPPPTPKKTE